MNTSSPRVGQAHRNMHRTVSDEEAARCTAAVINFHNVPMIRFEARTLLQQPVRRRECAQ
eukprot:6172994-Pleurochrysis_carterae.AAC.2